MKHSIPLLILLSLIAACDPGPRRTPDCRPGFTRCGAVCVDLESSSQNCGACGVDCGGSECSSGTCGAPCENPARRRCGGKCVALELDETNCGACGVVCPENHLCFAGRCSPIPDASHGVR